MSLFKDKNHDLIILGQLQPRLKRRILIKASGSAKSMERGF